MTNPFAATAHILVSAPPLLSISFEGRVSLTSQIVRRQIQRIRPKRNPIIAIPRLRIPRCATEDEIRVVAVEVAHAMVVAVDDGAAVRDDDVDERLEVGFVG